MRRDDSFDLWHVDAEFRRSLDPEAQARLDAQSRHALDQLQEFLDHPPARPNFWNVRLGAVPEPYGLPHDQVSRAQDLYHRVLAMGGAGINHIQEKLLKLIAATEDPVSIPFWLEIIELARPRDSFAARRRTIAVAALAWLTLDNVPEAVAALRQLAQHSRSDIRALAVYNLGRTYLEAERPSPPDLLALVSEMAVHDPAFEPRFQSRIMLQETGNPVPLDNPGGAYAFHVKYKRAKGIVRTIELKSEDLLEDLHLAIQRALKWDNDHLYAFYLNGLDGDDRYAFVSPDDDNGPRWTTEIAIGELGLAVKHKFLYVFDYGDNHQFEIRVAGIYAQAERGKYPRVVESQGEIKQYPSWEEE